MSNEGSQVVKNSKYRIAQKCHPALHKRLQLGMEEMDVPLARRFHAFDDSDRVGPPTFKLLQ